MIFEFASEVIVEMMRTDTYTHTVVIHGIPRDHSVEDFRINQRGNLEVKTKDKNGKSSTDRCDVFVADLRGNNLTDLRSNALPKDPNKA